jgi:hypothetical protein
LLTLSILGSVCEICLLVPVWCRIFCLPVCMSKLYGRKYAGL